LRNKITIYIEEFNEKLKDYLGEMLDVSPFFIILVTIKTNKFTL